jgi:hypothetical protein
MHEKTSITPEFFILNQKKTVQKLLGNMHIMRARHGQFLIKEIPQKQLRMDWYYDSKRTIGYQI